MVGLRHADAVHNSALSQGRDALRGGDRVGTASS
jgi:hypothetical protein